MANFFWYFLASIPLLGKANFSTEKMDKLWAEKKYYACYKTALSESKKHNDQAVPILYQALCLNQLQSSKKIIKKKKYSVYILTDLTIQMRSRNPDGKQLEKYQELLHRLQDTLFAQGKWRYEFFLEYQKNQESWNTSKEEKIKQTKSQHYKKEAERIFNAMHKTFDNKTTTWKSWYDQQHDYIIEGYDFPEYNNPVFRFCNTAKNEEYLNDIEKQLFYFTNLARMNPDLFRSTYYKKNIPNPEGEYEVSLNSDLAAMKPAPILFPDKDLWKAAVYHAEDLGKTGQTGHSSSDGTYCFDRIRKIAGKGASGENCAYGPNYAFSILMLLLIDEGIPSKGHRYNQLGNTSFAGIAHRPHKSYGWNTVFDFR
jgi:hypothetical protein